MHDINNDRTMMKCMIQDAKYVIISLKVKYSKELANRPDLLSRLLTTQKAANELLWGFRIWIPEIIGPYTLRAIIETTGEIGVELEKTRESYRKQKAKRGVDAQTTIQEIHGDVYAPVVQAVESQVNFNQQVATAFQQARNMTETRKGISQTLMGKIKKHLDLLEEELKSKEPDAGKIQALWKWLKRNANWVVPTLTRVVLESLRIVFG